MSAKPENIVKLEEQQKRMLDELALIKVASAEADESREGSPFGKREEEATEAFELEKRLAIESQLNDNLDKINQALAKYKAGTYGQCDQCGKQIEKERLEALPQAGLCLACKAAKSKFPKGRTAR